MSNTEIIVKSYITFIKKISKNSFICRFIDVDIYGKCGNLKCGHNTVLRNIELDLPLSEESVANDPCNKMLDKYYFYLAFENSICKLSNWKIVW